MTCTEFERLLDQREPDAQTQTAMQRHAEQCEHCRMLLELRALDRDEEVPELASVRWKAAIRTERAKAEAGQRRKGFLSFRGLAAACAALAVLVAAFALRNPLTNVKPETAMMLSAPVEEIAETEEAVEAPMPALGAVMETPAPTIRLAATGLPTTGNALYSAARKSQANTDMALNESVLSELNAAPMEEAMYEETDESPDEAAALGSVSAAAQNAAWDSLPDTVRIAWLAERPAEAARQLLEALALPENALETAGGNTVELRFGINTTEWERFVAALQSAGCDVLPAYDEMPWDESGETRFFLRIDEKEQKK